MERNPHLLIEGCAIGCYAIGAKVAYIYIRGEFFHVQHVLERAIDEALRARVPRQEHPRLRLRLRRLRAPRRRRLRGGRGDGAARVARRQARAAAQQAAVSGRRSASTACPTAVNNVETLCNVPLDRRERAPSGSPRSARRRTAGPKLYCVSGHVEAAGRLRGVDARHAARADRRLRRRRPRRADAQGGDSRRIVGADPAARSARHAGQLRRRAEGRLAARIGRRSSCSTTRPAWSGWPRTCCTSTATSRAASARRAARAPTGCTRSCSRSSAARDRCATSTCSSSISGQHRRQDAVRVRRRRGRRRC